MPEPETRAAAAAGQLTATADEILLEVQQLPPELIHWLKVAIAATQSSQTGFDALACWVPGISETRPRALLK